MGIKGTVVLKAGKERKVKNNYPWIQRGEVIHYDESLQDGDLARLVTEDDEFLAVGSWNSQSRFRFRVLSKVEEEINGEFFKNRFLQAIRLRDTLIEDTNGRRIVYSEADQIPGLIIDEYDSHLIVQVRSKGMEMLKQVWLPALIEAAGPKSIFERSEMAGREEEGLGPYAGQLHGTTPPEIEIYEGGLKFIVAATGGLKTGFYLDQRATRREFAKRVKPGQKVLDGFCYTGAFSMYAAKSGAETLGLDISEDAVRIAQKNAELNGVSSKFEAANVFDWLDKEPSDLYDWIVLDPPAIAKTEASRDSLKWAIWKLAHRSIPHLKPGGRIIACSCSYQLDRRELVETVRLAASDRGVRMFLEDVTLQDLDHPSPIQFPESLYLKCAWLRLDG